MSPALALVLVLVITAYVGLITPTLFRLCKTDNLENLSSEWLEQFSPRSYDPMDRLLSGEDFAFLSRQPGFDLMLYRKFRQDRLRIFRQYLKRMIADFNRLHLMARLLLSQSSEDHSEQLNQLVRLKIRFAASVLHAEFRYALCFLGIQTLSVRQLIVELEELAEVVAIAMPAKSFSA